jgi:protein SCO1/2
MMKSLHLAEVAALALLWAVPAFAADQPSAAAQAMRKYFPNIELKNAQGNSVRFYDDVVKGKVLLIQWMFTHCTRSCPVATPKLLRVQRQLEQRLGDKVRLVSISVDPKHDNPAALKKYASGFRRPRNWVLLTGNKNDVDLIRRKLGVYDPDEKRLEHMNVLTVGNEPEGQWLAMPVFSSDAEIVRTVMRIADQKRQGLRPAGQH